MSNLLLIFLKRLGVNIYIDYLDDNLPDKPNEVTAAILREKIKSSQKFILMATPNSNESNWIPWEFGLGDGFIKKNGDWKHIQHHGSIDNPDLLKKYQDAILNK